MAVTELVSRSGIAYSIKVNAHEIVLTGTSGTFEYGETVTGGTSNATGEVIFYDADNTTLYVAAVTDTFQTSETVTGADSSASGTVSGTPADDWMTDYETLSRIRDSVSLNQSRAVTEIVDFDSAETDYADKITGIKSGNLGATQNYVPGSVGYQLIEGAYNHNLDIRIKRVRTDRAGANSDTRHYEGIVSQFNETDSATDVSTVAWQIELSDVSIADFA